MDHSLQRYLNDHLAGSSGALHMIDKVVDGFELPEAKAFFVGLKKKIETDREVLKGLTGALDEEPSAILEAAGKIVARVGSLKLDWEGTDPGELGLFEALELLALGVYGKALLWGILGEIQPHFPEWVDHDFASLNREAIRQRDGVEFWRVQTGRESLVSVERRNSGSARPRSASPEA